MHDFDTPPNFLYSSSMWALPNSSRRWQYKEATAFDLFALSKAGWKKWIKSHYGVQVILKHPGGS